MSACALCHNTSVHAQIRFRDASNSSGLTSFVHEDGSTGKHFLVEAVSSGMASFDFDEDGRADLYFLSGNSLLGKQSKLGSNNTLFRNLGDETFRECSMAHCGSSQFSLGVAAGDIDNDGFSDLYINNYGENELYLNNGDGTFSISRSVEIACGKKVGAGVSMLDMDQDGDLDIYVANYIQFSKTMREPEVFHQRVVYGGPVLYPRQTDDLLENLGDGTFKNVSATSGISEVSEWGMGTLALDVDDDGDSDILVANDSTSNTLWLNDGSGKFEDSALLSGFAYNALGDAEGSMGLDAADVDGDGSLDVLQTSYENQTATLYFSLGLGMFQDMTARSGGLNQTNRLVNWGCGFSDFDNDGQVDAFFANGHIHDNLDEFNDLSPHLMPNMIFRGIGRGRFAAPQELDAGSPQSSRGASLEDFNGDGLTDIAVLNSRSVPTLLINDSAAGNYLRIEIAGSVANRDAVGAKVTVIGTQKKWTQERICGRGYQSHFGDVLHFGVGNTASVKVEIRWPGGNTDVYPNISANQRIKIVQEDGVYPMISASPGEEDER